MMRVLIYDDINKERDRQVAKHGDKAISSPDVSNDVRLRILVEEVGEIARAIEHDDAKNLREELTQVAACAIGWLETMKP